MFTFYLSVYIYKNSTVLKTYVFPGMSASPGSLLDRKKANPRNLLTLDLAFDTLMDNR